MSKRILTAALTAMIAVGPIVAQTPVIKITPAEKKAAVAITAKQMSDYLHFVASDEMEGRDTPSRGLDTTAKFLAMNLSRWGFKPAGDNGTYFQKIALKSESSDPVNNNLQIGSTTYKFLDDYIRLSGNGQGTGTLVFAGNGWMVKSKNIDAYAGVDVKGKIVVLAGQGFPRGNNPTGMPQGVTRDDLKGTKGVDWADPLTYAEKSGAVGVIVIASPQLDERWTQVKSFLTRGNVSPEKLNEGGNNVSKLPVIMVNGNTGNDILTGASAGIDSKTAFAINKNVTINSNSRIETLWTQNVVALWEGTDPKLKSEMVAIGAHYDHVGMNPNAPGPDKIWNGADDDGSGTVAVLSIAEALAKAPVRPKRSILFVWHCGEEKGLWGSEYFNKFPTVDIKQVIAQLNIDMIGRSKKPGDTNPKNAELSGENEIYVIGKDMMSSTLGTIVDGTNKSYINLKYDTRYDDPNDKNRFFFRSDHFNYAQNGIPITFWFDGVHEDYHGPDDNPNKIDYQKMEKVTRTIFLTLWELTDLAVRPVVDKKLPPELTGNR